MSQLLQQIRAAQIRAGEDAVIANLQSMGLARAERDAPTALAASITAQVIAALMDGCEAGVPSCIAVVKALADKHGYHRAEIDE